MINTHELAWAAGFYDGEGCTYVNRPNGYRQLLISINQSSDTMCLDRFRAAVGRLGKVTGPYGRYRSDPINTKPKYRFTAGKFEESQAIVAFLWKFLSPTKKAQAKKAVLAYHACARKGK